MARHDLREVVLVEEDVPLDPPDDAVGEGRGDAVALRRRVRGGAARDGAERPDTARDVAPWDAHPGATEPPTGRRPPVRLGRRRVATLAVLVALLATAAVTDGVRERRQDVALAGLPGLLEPLGPGLQERWRVPSGWGQMSTVGGDLVIGRTGDDGEDELVGVDTATGAEQWVTPMPELSETAEVWCETLGDAERGVTSHLACLLVTRGRDGLGRRAARADPGALLVVVDTATGARVAERSMSTRYPTLESLGDDLAVVELLDDGHVRVARTDPVSGRERWSFRSPEPVPTAGRFRDTPVPVLRDDVLLVTGTTGWALSLDGDLLGEWDLRGAQLPALLGTATPEMLTVLPDGRFAAARPGAGTARHGRFGTVSAGDAGDGFTIPGPVLEPAVDDGSADDVLLTAHLIGGALTAQQATDGRRLWTREEGVRGEALVLDRRLVTVSGDAVMALDVRSGDPLWQVPLDGRRVGLLTDGHVVVAGVPGPEGDRVLVAWGIEDGRERWRAPLPTEVEVLRSIGGHLVAFTGDHVVALG